MRQPALLDRLRARRWRLTAQRPAVAEASAGGLVHAGADPDTSLAHHHLVCRGYAVWCGSS